MGKVIVIGGGAAGMIAAVAAASANNSVCLFEKNEKLGKKLYITGKGRCNVTNAAGMETIFQNVCANEKFLYSAFHCFDNRGIMDLLERAGCPLKTERGDRVFPVSDHASDVIGALAGEMKRLKVEIRLKSTVERIITAGQKQTGAGEEHTAEAGPVFCGVELADGGVEQGDACIVCTGGLSYPATGSTGDGFRFAEHTGHRVTECRPALVPLCTEEKWCGELMGLSLKNVSITLKNGKKEIYSGFGEMLFTHFGVSGPLILSAASYYAKAKCGRARLFVDLKPALTEEQLDRRVLRDFEENKNRQFKNALGGLFPARLIPVMIELSGISPDKKVNEITREERRKFAALIKALPLTVTGTRGFGEAIVTSGGVCVKDINPSTMESKKVKGLYFAGEVLDTDALTGGFNLQIAWSTGYLAGYSAGNKNKARR